MDDAHEVIARAAATAAPAEPPTPNDRDLADLPRNDTGNARRLIERYGRDLMMVDDHGWFTWDGRRWCSQSAKRAPEAVKLAHRTVDAMRDEVRSLADELQSLRQSGAGIHDLQEMEKRVQAHRQFAVASGNTGRVEAMLKAAEPYLRCSPQDLDTDPFLINVHNGTLEIGPASPEGDVPIRLRPHDRLDRITRLMPIEYDPEATCPQFEAFFAAIQPDPQVRAFLMRYLGYCLTGDTREQVLLLAYGKGANGKTTLFETLAEAFGDYAMTLPIQTFLHDDRRRGGDATPDLARLPGVRYVLAAEPDRGARLSESVVKTITGGEKIAARHLFEGMFEFTPTFKLVLCANEKPAILGQDEGIWRRVNLVPFETFIPAERRDKRLREKLRRERPGIFNLLLDGLRLWREQGLAIPEAISSATDQYRTESDPIGEFLRLCTQPSPGARVRAGRLYQVYSRWSHANALQPVSMTQFGRRLSDKGVHKEKAGVFFYTGIELAGDGLDGLDVGDGHPGEAA
jgi:putative DNA primase/helicase